MSTYKIRDLYKIRNMGDGIRVRWTYDRHYQTRGSYSCATDAETLAAERWEIDMLDRGDWVALGATVEQRTVCDCPACDGWHETDALWGIVVEPDGANLDEFAQHSLDLERTT